MSFLLKEFGQFFARRGRGFIGDSFEQVRNPDLGRPGREPVAIEVLEFLGHPDQPLETAVGRDEFLAQRR